MSANFKSSLDGTKAIIGVGGGDQLELNQSGKLTVTGSGQFNGNVTVYGDLSATGTSYFANTVYSTTSALSVINVGNTGPAFYVGNNGTGDIASFYDLDQGLEVLHVGGSNGTFPNVGIKTSTPGETLTVNGTVSASGLIYSNGRTLKPLSGVGGIVVNDSLTNVTVISADSSMGSGITLMTEVTASGVSTIEVSDIPSSVKRITITHRNTNLGVDAACFLLVQLGTSTGFITSGYQSVLSAGGASINYKTDSFHIGTGSSNNGVRSMQGTATLRKSSSNFWTIDTNCTNYNAIYAATGEMTTPRVPSRLRISSDTNYIQGIFSISYES